MPFTLDRVPRDLVFRPVTLTARERLAPHYLRLRLEGDALRGFDSLGSDDHLRLFFPGAQPADGTSDVAAAADVDALRECPSREYTPLAWDGDAGVLEIEFVVHGEHGIAGRWADRAPIGSVIGVGGPRGSMVITGEPDGWLLAGDETALPAIRRFLARLSREGDATPRGLVLVEVPDAAHQPAFEAPAGTELRWVHRDGRAPGAALIAALDALGADERPAGEVFAFVAAEHAIVKPGRALVLDRWGLSPEQVVVKGYWRRGEAEYHAPH
ncbi:siderophore-interacting protein [Agromyces mediolanus]|uniref:siderophore-interacting protein n=1 Tax=Agromyces mediolanus TaxID=41986 RepID=UPI00203AE892|nr:siderophore-interacting protein [Agromyces mediolanus]MCM3659170.1 siderophore-interacting protein [Agromyces mediolanus]